MIIVLIIIFFLPVAIQGLNGEFNSHPHYPHLAPNMIIRDDSMDFFRKISQPHQAISMMPRSNNPGSFINIDQLNTAENGLFVVSKINFKRYF